MIDELNLLASRIEQLVGKMRVLSGETKALRQQVVHLESEKDTLTNQLQIERNQAQSLKDSLVKAQAADEKSRHLAEQDKSTLQGTLDLFRREKETIQSSLTSRETEVKRLREVNEQARQRIDGVLERLPGALQQELN